MTSMPRAVLFDLDGVIRHFDAEYVAALERRHGLADGAIGAVAFSPDILDAVTRGSISRAEWIAHIADRVGNADALREWDAQPHIVDPQVLALNDELRASGVRTAILTNGTDTVPAEVTAMGLTDQFERIFNSASIGVVKPDPRVFRHVLRELELSPGEVFFTDDSPGKLVGADHLGIVTHHFTSPGALRSALRARGLPVAS